MIASLENVSSGFCLNDETDLRYQYIASLRQRYGTFLHEASVSLRQQGEENTVDAVDMLVSRLRIDLYFALNHCRSEVFEPICLNTGTVGTGM